MHFVIKHGPSGLYLGPKVMPRQNFESPQWLDRKNPMVCRFTSKESAEKHLCWVICRYHGTPSYRRARVVTVRRRDPARTERTALMAELKRRWEKVERDSGAADAFGGLMNWLARRCETENLKLAPLDWPRTTHDQHTKRSTPR